MTEDMIVEIDLSGDSDSFLFDINAAANQFVTSRMKKVSAKDVGLDIRAAGRLYVDQYHIVVPVGCDRSMQYYGGFEYVDKQYRSQVGDYVFYSAEDSRVCSHLSRVVDGVDSGDDEDYD